MAALEGLRGWAEGLGASARVRQNVVAGEASGTISFVTLWEDAAARAAYMDASRAQAESNPILAALDTAEPALTIISRAFLQEVDPLPGLPPMRRCSRTRRSAQRPDMVRRCAKP